MENTTIIITYLVWILFYLRFKGIIKLFAHEYVTYSYPDENLIVVHMNDEFDTRHHWDMRDNSCVTTAGATNVL